MQLLAGAPPEGMPRAQAESEAFPAAPARMRAAAPAEASSANLQLALVDSATGRAIAGEVEIWQLDLRADEHFTAGDRLHDRFLLPAEGTTLGSVPAGRYRVFLLNRRSASEDPPEFELTARGRLERLEIELPKVTHFTLDLRDAYGWAIESAHMRKTSALVPSEKAPFAEERKSLGPRSGSSGCGKLGVAEDRPDPLVTRGPGGFDVGVHAERTPRGGTRMMYRFLEEGVESVLFQPPDYAVRVNPHKLDGFRVVEERVVVAVAMPLGFFDDVIRLPDGSAARERGANIDVECRPLLVEADSPADLWRSCPIEVRASLGGYSTLRFTYRLSDGPPAPRTLSPDRW